MIELPAWAEVDLKALAHNAREIRRVTDPQAEVMAVVKANAYGHGSVEVSKVALANGATRLAVARAAEGAELRRAGLEAPIIVLGYTPPGLIREVVEYGLEQTVYGVEYALMVNEQAAGMGAKVPVHIKIDTGMGRLGLMAGSSSSVAGVKKIAALPHLEPVGIFTHFAAADSADKSFTKRQWESFIGMINALSREGLEFPLKHCANSAAIIDLPENCLNMVRAGIILYGLYPSVEVNRQRMDLKPVMSFKTRVAQVKEVPAGYSISYGCTYITEKATVIAVLPVGYADGYSRRLSSRGEVLIRGRRAPVVGRVCMDQCMVDVGSIPGVVAGNEVVLFGRQGEQMLPVEEVAGWIGTINYEVVCMVGARVPRIYMR
ncbi:MAG: alanine racemase [Peptococcaceae bacterium]|nr:alanine racemase [Peptococcaceae bacterium]